MAKKIYGTGTGSNGELDNNQISGKSIPTVMSGTYDKVAAGKGFTVAIDSTGFIRAWGKNDEGQLGNNTTNSKSTPTMINRSGSFLHVAAGEAHVVAVSDVGRRLWSWGRNNIGQLGNSTSGGYQKNPESVHNTLPFVAVACGRNHTLALDATGQAWACGENYSGQLGVNDLDVSYATNLLPVVGGHSFKAIACGANHSLAIDGYGVVYAWGNSTSLQCATNIPENRVLSPKPVYWSYSGTQVSYNAVSVAGGSNHSLMLNDEGMVVAWGSNTSGCNGNGVLGEQSPFSIIRKDSYIAIAGGINYSTAITSGGDAYTWGANNYGQLGINSINNQTSPVSVYGNRMYMRTAPAPTADHALWIGFPNTRTADFTDLSTGTPTSWVWEFSDDPSNLSATQNPTHKFPAYNTAYTVTLSATNTGGTGVSAQSVTTGLAPAYFPMPNANATPIGPLTVGLTAPVTGDFLYLLWEFGDGTSAITTTGFSIAHTYPSIDVYTLVVKINGESVMAQTTYINIMS